MLQVKFEKDYKRGVSSLTLKDKEGVLILSELHSEEYVDLDTIETFFFCFKEDAYDSELTNGETKILLNISSEDVIQDEDGKEFTRHLKDFQDEFRSQKEEN